MRVTSVISKFLMWAALVFCTGCQVLAMFGIGQNNAVAIEAGKTDKVYGLWPMIITTLLLLAGVLLFIFWKKRRYIGLIVAAVAGVAAMVIAFDLLRAFPSQIGATGDVGLTTSKMIVRHMSPLLVPLLMIPAFICDHLIAKEEQARLVTTGASHFDLTGSPLFSDEETQEPVRKEKRSVRVARRKQEEA